MENDEEKPFEEDEIEFQYDSVYDITYEYSNNRHYDYLN